MQHRYLAVSHALGSSHMGSSGSSKIPMLTIFIAPVPIKVGVAFTTVYGYILVLHDEENQLLAAYKSDPASFPVLPLLSGESLGTRLVIM